MSVKLVGRKGRYHPKDSDEVVCHTHGVVTTWGALDAIQQLALEEGLDTTEELECLLAPNQGNRSKLTKHDFDALRAGARHPDGVISPARKSNFDKPERRMAKLVAAGLAEPSPHGDWYITAAGRAVLAQNS